jgi:hypothetical protein
LEHALVTRLQLGAPGVYALPPEPIRQLTGARMDVCAFVGVGPRGPARRPVLDGDASWIERPCDGDAARWPRSTPVPVESFDQYRRLYGGFEGPGLLPYALASFFENGGLRAYTVRIVPSYGGDDEAAPVARGGLVRIRPPREIPAPPAADPGPPPLRSRSGSRVALRARDEGAWGNDVTGILSFDARPFAFQSSTLTSFLVAFDVPPPAGSLLRVAYPSGLVALRFVAGARDAWTDDPAQALRLPQRQRFVDLEAALPMALADPSEARVDLVLGTLTLEDGDGRSETHSALGLSSSHPRWLARVLYQESDLLWPAPDGTTTWYLEDLDVASDLAPYALALSGGADDFGAVAPEDFLDDRWQPSDPCPGDGIQCLAGLPDLAAVCAPDLYAPFPLDEEATAPDLPGCGPDFQRALPRPPPGPPPRRVAQLTGLALDPSQDLEAIVGYQKAVVEFAEAVQAIALLDVPPGLELRQMLRWRGRFGSAYAAAYHPWLDVSRLDDQRGLVPVPPSAVAAGIIAQRELALGIPHGPANAVALGVVNVRAIVSPAAHDALHPAGVNVFLRERDGVRLTAARTLSRDPAYRQLSVRRLVTMLRRTLDQQMQWAVFEPNDARLRRELRRMLGAYLGELFRLDAFAGATEEQSFFVRCDEEQNPPRVVNAGQLICEIGVAPAEPLEFIVLRVERGGDGTIRVEG